MRVNTLSGRRALFTSTVMAVVGLVGLTFAAHPVQAQTLTGISLFATNSTGAAGGDIWNTNGGDSFYNLWVTGPSGVVSGPGSNGNTDAQASLNPFSLSSPGVYTFTIEGNPGVNANFHGLNLFFNGSTTTPLISGYTATANTISQVNPLFADGQSTISLTGSPTPGANTLSFNAGVNNITLSSFRWEYTSVRNVDSVSSLTRTPNGTPDNRGSFTITVGAPEPGTFALLGTGLVSMGGIAVRRRKSKMA